MMSKNKGRQEYNVSAEKFVETWQTSESAQEVADKLGMPKAVVHARVSNYREAGIKLKKMVRKSPRAMNVEALNKLCEQLLDGEHRKPKKK
jgi:transposase